MSLIHKALKKAQGDIELPDTVSDEFAGRPRSQITLRTVTLIIILILSLALLIYKRLHQPRPLIPTPSSAILPSPAAPLPSTFSTIEPLVKDGEALFAQGEYDRALAKFLEALSMAPNSANVLNNIGLTHKKNGNLNEAENYYKQALSIKPDYPECLNNLGVLKDALNDVLEASIYFKKAVSFKADYADPYFNLAVLNERQGNFEEAINNYKLFLKFSTNEALVGRVKRRIEAIIEK